MKKRWNKGGIKRNKSVSDLEVDFCCSQMLGSRSFSHDSIFLADQYGSEPQRPRVFSHENIHGKIQALQMKLKQKKIHLGPIPLITFKENKDSGGCLEDICLTHSPSEHLHKFASQSVSPRPLGPMPPPLCPAGVDFSTLPQFIPCLDNSAAWHRMSIKPRNQRASTKSRRMPSTTGSSPWSESMIILERTQIESENEEGNVVTKKMSHLCSYSSQIIKPGKGPTTPPVKSPLSVSSLKSPLGAKNTINQSRGSISPAFLQQDHVSKQQTPTCESKSTEGDDAAVRTWQAPKSAEEMMAKPPSTAVLTIQKRSEGQREALSGSKLNSVQGYKQSLELSETEKGKESNTITTDDKGNVLEKNGFKEVMHQYNHKSQPLRPHSLQRKTSTLDKVEVRNVQQISTVPLPAVEAHLPKQFPNQQISVSMSPCLTIVSDKRRDRQYTGNFTVPVDIQVVPGRDPSELQKTAATSPVVPIKPENQTLSFSVIQQRGHNQDNSIQVRGGEVNTISDAMEGTNISSITSQRKDKEKSNAPRVKRHTTSLPPKISADTTQSEFNIKQPITEMHSLTTPNLQESTAPSDSQVSRSLPQSSRDQANCVPVRLPDLEPSSSIRASTALPSLSLKEGTPECIIKNSVQTDAKEPSEALTEQSWMDMALEKTRSLQQLFTSRLNEFTGLQTTTRPAAFSKTQISTSLPSAGTINQISVEQSSIRPPNIQSSVRATASTVTQPVGIRDSFTPVLSTTGNSEAENYSIKRPLSKTSQEQTVQLGARPGQSAITYTSTTEFDAPYEAQEQLFQMSESQAHTIQQSLPHRMTKLQTSQCNLHLDQPSCLQLHLSSNPELIFHQHSQRSPSPILPQRQRFAGDWTSMSQRKSSVESTVQWAGTLPTDQRQNQKHYAEKVADQKSTTIFQEKEFGAITSDSKLTALSGHIKLDKEDKCQRKPVPSSSPTQSFTDSGQPSWMELAKKKSMAWSDKTMD